jgi:hypothetical protein
LSANSTNIPGPLADNSGRVFAEYADFDGVSFAEYANFDSAIFMKSASFVFATFRKGASFKGAIFTEEARFDGAIFDKWAFFNRVTFTERASFSSVTFTEGVSFEGAIFTESAVFSVATFIDWARFDGVIFTKEAFFLSATFAEKVTFINSTMKYLVSFDNAVFACTPPEFDGATLHEGTTWFDVTWPPAPRRLIEAREALRAYERLKLEMDRLKKHEDELNFFGLELQARRVVVGRWSTVQGLAIGIYGFLSDYGRSYSRPLWLLGAVTALGAPPFLTHFGFPGWRGSLALSAANTFGVLGLRREFFPPSVIIGLPPMLKLLSAAQTVAGAILFFLFGLGLRNRFRMR